MPLLVSESWPFVGPQECGQPATPLVNSKLALCWPRGVPPTPTVLVHCGVGPTIIVYWVASDVRETWTFIARKHVYSITVNKNIHMYSSVYFPLRLCGTDDEIR